MRPNGLRQHDERAERHRIHGNAEDRIDIPGTLRHGGVSDHGVLQSEAAIGGVSQTCDGIQCLSGGQCSNAEPVVVLFKPLPRPARDDNTSRSSGTGNGAAKEEKMASALEPAAHERCSFGVYATNAAVDPTSRMVDT